MEDIVIEFEIDHAKVISVNDQYIHPVRKSNNGKHYSYFAPSNELAEVQEFYSEKLKEFTNEEQLKALRDLVEQSDKKVGLSVEIIWGVPGVSYRRKKNFFQMDATNYIKAFEDCLSRHLGIDDSCNYKVICEKQVYTPEDGEYRWIVHARVTPYEYKEYIIGGN